MTDNPGPLDGGISPISGDMLGPGDSVVWDAAKQGLVKSPVPTDYRAACYRTAASEPTPGGNRPCPTCSLEASTNAITIHDLRKWATAPVPCPECLERSIDVMRRLGREMAAKLDERMSLLDGPPVAGPS